MHSWFAIFLAGATPSAATFTPADWRSDEPFMTAKAHQPIAVFERCLQSAWAQRRGQISRTETPTGLRLTLAFGNLGSSFVAAQVDAVDQGGTTAVSVRAKGANKSKRLRQEISDCL